jgi:hypothetical protein
MCANGLGGNPTPPWPDSRGSPDRHLLPWWRGNQGRLPLDPHLVKEPCEAASGLARRRRLLSGVVGMALPRRRQQCRLRRRWLWRTNSRGHLQLQGGGRVANPDVGHTHPRILKLPQVLQGRVRRGGSSTVTVQQFPLACHFCTYSCY